MKEDWEAEAEGELPRSDHTCLENAPLCRMTEMSGAIKTPDDIEWRAHVLSYLLRKTFMQHLYAEFAFKYLCTQYTRTVRSRYCSSMSLLMAATIAGCSAATLRSCA